MVIQEADDNLKSQVVNFSVHTEILDQLVTLTIKVFDNPELEFRCIRIFINFLLQCNQ